MKIQYVSKYLALAEEGLVDRILCPLDQGPLSVNMSHDESIFLYCLSCEYKKGIGILFYNKIKDMVENAIQ